MKERGAAGSTYAEALFQSAPKKIVGSFESY